MQRNLKLLLLPAPEQVAAETLVEQPVAREIAFLLGTYPDVVRTTLWTHESSGVVTFAFRLAHGISSAWETVVVKRKVDVECA
jgi:arginyl-tRNA synthetase